MEVKKEHEKNSVWDSSYGSILLGGLGAGFVAGYEVAYEEGYDAGYRDGYQFGELDGRQMVFELMRDVGSGSYDAVGDCLIVRDFDSDGAHRMPWPREKVKYVVWEEKIE